MSSGRKQAIKSRALGLVKVQNPRDHCLKDLINAGVEVRRRVPVAARSPLRPPIFLPTAPLGSRPESPASGCITFKPEVPSRRIGCRKFFFSSNDPSSSPSPHPTLSSRRRERGPRSTPFLVSNHSGHNLQLLIRPSLFLCASIELCCIPLSSLALCLFLSFDI